MKRDDAINDNDDDDDNDDDGLLLFYIPQTISLSANTFDSEPFNIYYMPPEAHS